jgi:hypothetical protein
MQMRGKQIDLLKAELEGDRIKLYGACPAGCGRPRGALIHALGFAPLATCGHPDCVTKKPATEETKTQ